MKIWALAGVLIGVVAVAAQCSPKTMRYRMTVEVQTPEGVRSGSSVVEGRIVSQLPLMGADGVRYQHQGEAVAIDLPDGSLLFALLGNDAYHVALPTHGWLRGNSEPEVKAEMPAQPLRERDALDWPILRRRQPLLVLAPEDYPLLARFADVNDPASVEFVHADGLAATYGAGYSLFRVTIQPTDDALEWTLHKKLPWLESQAIGYLPGPIARSKALSVFNFRRRL